MQDQHDPSEEYTPTTIGAPLGGRTSTVDPPWYQSTPPLHPSSPTPTAFHHSSTARAYSAPHRPNSLYLTAKLKRPQPPSSSPHRPLTIAMLLFTALHLFPRPGSMVSRPPSATAPSPAALHFNRSTTYSPHRTSPRPASRGAPTYSSQPAAATPAQVLQAQAHRHHQLNAHVLVPARVQGHRHQCNNNRTITAFDPSQWVAKEPQQSPSEEPSNQSKKRKKTAQMQQTCSAVKTTMHIRTIQSASPSDLMFETARIIGRPGEDSETASP